MAEKKYVIDNAELMAEWDWEKNADISPSQLTLGSGKKAWWKCGKGHEWQATIYNRNKGNGCPYCSGRIAIRGENDFATIHPELLSEWNYDKNTFVPNELLPSSGKKAWWKCEKGHEWETSLNNRHNGTGCPICAKEANSSFPETAIAFYLSKCITVESRKKIYKKEVDIYIPSLSLGIEYDGQFYHNNDKVQKRDEEKTSLLTKKGISLVRVKESSYNLYDEKNKTLYFEFDNQYKFINKVVIWLINHINNTFNTNLQLDVNIERDRLEILSYYKTLKHKNSLATKHPLLANEWNYSKNRGLLPENFDFKSRHKVWWKCIKDHEWEASVYSRVAGNGCPYCANQKLLKGYNDLQTVAPIIAREWNYEKNGNLSPDEVIAKTDRTVWWRCDKGHEWQARISNRMNGNNCPYCANKKVLYGYNDLKTWCIVNGKLYLIDEFDTVKNGFDMSEISPGSGKKIWWICSNNHSYCTSLSHRINMHTGCPYCSNKKLLPGYNDLATTHPEIAKDWDYNKNGNVTPFDVMAGSNNKKYWFVCENGHSYSSNLLNRKKGRGCPICRKNKKQKA